MTGPTPTAIIDLPDVTVGLPFHTLFDPDKPLEVDVGCGFGRFLLARAAAHPEHQFLGIDRMQARIRKIDRKVMRAGMTHVRLLRLEAFYSLQFLLPPHCVRTFHIYFPDPWPKRRHHRRRLFSETFLDALWSRLEPGGTVQVATDHLDYFAEIRKRLAADPRFSEVPHMPRSAAEQTDFELIFRGQGLPVGECAFITRPAPSTPSAPRS
jgi:tRNA (guanine-N7-)-methyltransferase